MPVLELTGVTKLFRGPSGQVVTALRDISLTLQPKELLSVVGPSGSGKTTLLRLIAGLEDPDSGTITLDGQPLSAIPAQRRDIAMVFQNGALYPHMSVSENLAFGLKLRKVGAQEISRRVTQMAELVGLGDCLTRRPAELSGGQRQRVALGRALVRHPKLLLLDEPLSNLDPQTRVELRFEIARLQKEMGITSVYVTHDHSEALTLGDRIAVLREGCFQQVAAPTELYERPANRFVAGFLGATPMAFLRGRLEVAGSDFIFRITDLNAAPNQEMVMVPLSDPRFSRLRSRAGQELELGVRPECLSLQGEINAREFAVCFRGRVLFLQNLGSDLLAHVSVAGHSLIARLPSFASVRANDQVSLVIEPRHLLFFNPSDGSAA